MATLKIAVEHLREGPLELEVRVQPQPLDLADELFEFKDWVTGRVVFQMVGNDVLGTGELHAMARTACARCLEPATVQLDAEVNEIWIKNRPEERIDQEFSAEAPIERSYTGEEIELDEAFRELILSELPIRPLCKEDCRGLCPKCGTNLNEDPGHSHPEEEEASPATDGAAPEWKKKLKNIKLE